MAEDIVKEQIYTIPLRGVKVAPRWKRAPKAITIIREYLERHMKAESDKIKLDKTINEYIWERGAEKPPSYIRIKAAKYADGEVQAELSKA